MVYGSNGYEVDYNNMPRQQKTNNLTTTIGTTTFVDKFSTYKLSGNTRTLESEEAIEYDSLGNITKYGNVTYKYDLCGRLVREDNPTIDKTIVWTYNDGSNITQRKEYAYTTSATLDVPTKIFALDYDGGWRDQVTAIEKQPVEYDYAGNPTSYRGMKLNWTRGRLLLCVEKSSGDYASLYDGNGIRKAQEIWLSNGKFWQYAYHYADGHLVAETRRLGAEVKHKIHYFYNQQGVIGMEYDDTHYLYRKNLFGDITAIYDRDTCVAKYAYDAYGVCKVMNPDGTENTDDDFIGNVNPIRYRGYYYDVGTGFYYLQTRYYDPQTGRFLNMDSLEYLDPETVGGLNLYAYCNCNPVMYVDPTGTAALWKWIALSAITLILLGCSVALTIATAGGAIVGAGAIVANTVAAVGYGFAGTVVENIANQYEKYGKDISQVDPLEAMSEGVKGGLIAGFAYLSGEAFCTIALPYLNEFGLALGRFTKNGVSAARAFSAFGGQSFISGVVKGVGLGISLVAGGVVGALIGDDIFNKDDSLENVINNEIIGDVKGWFKTLIWKFLLKMKK